MRNIWSLVILVTVLVGGCVLLLQFTDVFTNSVTTSQTESVSGTPTLKSNQQEKASADLLNGELYDLINNHSDEVLKKYGQPIRKDLSAYGYTWWVYTDHKEEYIQFGVKDNLVQTIYAVGNDISSEPFTIGTSYEDVSKQFRIKDKVTYKNGLSSYSFLLKDMELKMSPLIKVSDDIFVQTYFDTVTNTLSSIRIMTGELLLTQRFYEMEYRGNLDEDVELSKEEWKKVEKGMEKQILDITNIIRKRHQVNPLIQETPVAEVALLHSKDMYENEYFSHDRLDGTGLKERLAEKSIAYSAAGENIAAQYSDGPAAVEGWLNSEGHREALLNESYSHLGVGVYRLYYTQNFIAK